MRDLLLGTPSIDFDLVVEGDGIALAETLQREYGGRVTFHRRFGTAKWNLPVGLAKSTGLKTLDLVSARTEFYAHPSALPQVERGSIKLDLHRRDFSINTLAISLDEANFGDLYDFWGGLHDLEQGIIRVLHSLSFVDDPTRILRAVRLEQRLDFRLEERTARLVELALPLLERVSGDRIRSEFEYIFAEAEPERMLERLDALSVLAVIHPALALDEANGRLVSRFAAARQAHEREPQLSLHHLYLGLWLFHLNEAQLDEVCLRLKLRAHTSKVLSQVVALREQQSELADDLRLSALAERFDACEDLALVILALATDDQTLAAKLWHYRDELRDVQPRTSGDDLKARGLPPGPHYKVILDRLRAAWLDGEVSTLQEEQALLNDLLAELA